MPHPYFFLGPPSCRLYLGPRYESQLETPQFRTLRRRGLSSPMSYWMPRAQVLYCDLMSACVAGVAEGAQRGPY